MGPSQLRWQYGVMRVDAGRDGRLAALLVRTLSVAMVVAIIPSPASAQNAAPSRSREEVVVNGRTLPEEAQVRALARAISPRTGWDEPLARFDDPVCFGTGGLARPLLEAIGARLAEDAAEARVPLAGNGCEVNVLLLFVEDGPAELRRLLKRRPGLFGALRPGDVRAIIDEPGPVHVVTTSEIRSSDGDRLVSSPGDVPTLKVSIASRIVLPIRRDLMSSLVLIDRRAAEGLSVQQIADYVAMRALAMIRPRGASGGSTILTLFDSSGAVAPLGLTPFDRGYLKALYQGSGNQRGATKVGMIARSIIKDGREGKPPPR